MIQESGIDRRYWCARLFAGFVGLVFLLASILKSTDVVLFAQQIKAYKIISGYPLLVFTAWAVIIVEMLIGTALVFAYRLKIAIPAAMFLLLVFIGANIWASATGTVSDCGCFGSWLKRSPEISILENIISMAALFFSWKWYNRKASDKRHIGIYAVITAGLAGIILPFAFGFSLPTAIKPQNGIKYLNFAEIVIDNHKVIDFSNGDFLLVVMDMECGHCRDLTFDLNILSDNREIPRVIAFCTNEKEQIRRYMEEFHPMFSIYRISEEDFWPLLGDSELPRIILIRDQRIVQAWSGIVPDENELKRLL